MNQHHPASGVTEERVSDDRALHGNTFQWSVQGPGSLVLHQPLALYASS